MRKPRVLGDASSLGTDVPESERSEIGTKLSTEIVKYLSDEMGWSQTRIGREIGTGRSFISRVAGGSRSLTLLHLIRLEKAVQKPLPLLLVQAVDQDRLDERMGRLYSALRDCLEASEQLRALGL